MDKLPDAPAPNYPKGSRAKFLRGLVVAAFLATLFPCLTAVALQFFSSSSINPVRYMRNAIVGAVVVALVVTATLSPQIYSFLSTQAPFLAKWLPPPADELESVPPLQFSPFKSTSFLFTIAFPEPLYIDRKTFRKAALTTLTYQHGENAFVLTFQKCLPKKMSI